MSVRVDFILKKKTLKVHLFEPLDICKIWYKPQSNFFFFNEITSNINFIVHLLLEGRRGHQHCDHINNKVKAELIWGKTIVLNSVNK